VREMTNALCTATHCNTLQHTATRQCVKRLMRYYARILITRTHTHTKGMRVHLEVKSTEVARIRMEREELGFLVLQAAQEAKGHLTDRLYGQVMNMYI